MFYNVHDNLQIKLVIFRKFFAFKNEISSINDAMRDVVINKFHKTDQRYIMSGIKKRITQYFKLSRFSRCRRPVIF